jgi:AraC-like DNA-binding protein
MFGTVGGLPQKARVPAANAGAGVTLRPTSLGVGARRVLDALREKQIDPTPLLSRVGLETDLNRGVARISAAAEVRLIEQAAQVTGDPTFGLRLAASGNSSHWGLAFYILAASQTVRESIRLLPRYVPLVNESTCWSVASSDAGAILRLRYVGLLRRGLKHATEYHLAALLQNLRKLVGRDFNPVHVSFAHFRTSGIRSFERYFGCPVEFGAEADQFSLSNGVLDMQNVRSDRTLCEILQGVGDEKTSRKVEKTQSFRQAVDNELFSRLARGEPKQERIAETLGVSTRTLVRRLAEEGTSFSALLDSLRRSLACQYLKEPGVSIDHIALLLGYSEVGSFTHAFQRWYGVAPSEAKADCGSRCRTLECVTVEGDAGRSAWLSELAKQGGGNDAAASLAQPAPPMAALQVSDSGHLMTRELPRSRHAPARIPLAFTVGSAVSVGVMSRQRQQVARPVVFDGGRVADG